MSEQNYEQNRQFIRAVFLSSISHFTSKIYLSLLTMHEWLMYLAGAPDTVASITESESILNMYTPLPCTSNRGTSQQLCHNNISLTQQVTRGDLVYRLLYCQLRTGGGWGWGEGEGGGGAGRGRGEVYNTTFCQCKFLLDPYPGWGKMQCLCWINELKFDRVMISAHTREWEIGK